MWPAVIICAIPTFVEEDASAPNCERETLVGEQTTIINPIKAEATRSSKPARFRLPWSPMVASSHV
jgi:hypothetical protein